MRGGGESKSGASDKHKKEHEKFLSLIGADPGRGILEYLDDANVREILQLSRDINEEMMQKTADEYHKESRKEARKAKKLERAIARAEAKWPDPNIQPNVAETNPFTPVYHSSTARDYEKPTKTSTSRDLDRRAYSCWKHNQ